MYNLFDFHILCFLSDFQTRFYQMRWYTCCSFRHSKWWRIIL